MNSQNPTAGGAPRGTVRGCGCARDMRQASNLSGRLGTSEELLSHAPTYVGTDKDRLLQLTASVENYE